MIRTEPVAEREQAQQERQRHVRELPGSETREGDCDTGRQKSAVPWCFDDIDLECLVGRDVPDIHRIPVRGPVLEYPFSRRPCRPSTPPRRRVYAFRETCGCIALCVYRPDSRGVCARPDHGGWRRESRAK